MELFYRKLGQGPAIVILHGVFGSGDNLFSISKEIAAAGFEVYLLDARNHGQSPHNELFDYEVMASDLNEFLLKTNIKNPILLGHSMGGKTVMQYAQLYDNYSKLIVVDIAPRYYPTHHNHIIAGLNAIPINELKSRNEAESIFNQYVTDPGESQFILKNIYRKPEGGFAWRINVPVISKNIYQVGSEISLDKKIDKPALFISGSDSSYITDGDIEAIKGHFTNAEFVEIGGANHWVHATKPAEFVAEVLRFSSSN